MAHQDNTIKVKDYFTIHQQQQQQQQQQSQDSKPQQQQQQENNPQIQIEADSVQKQLEAVTHRLARPAFLKDISCSRLPSQAASTSSLSPGEEPSAHSQPLHHQQHSQQIQLPQSHHKTHQFPQQRRKAFGYGNLGASDARYQSPLHNAVKFGNLDDFDAAQLPSLDCSSATRIAVHVLENDRRSDESRKQDPARAQELKDLQRAFVYAWTSLADLQLAHSLSRERMAADRGFSTFDHDNNDLVLAVDFNFYGTRMVTASSDHRLKVYDRKDETWSLIDTWRAHDAEIVDVKWNGPFTGSIVGSIGEDGRFNLWEEDLLEPPHSGRRFKRIQSIRSESRVPFCSLDFKNLHTETYVALITRDGYLSIFEPVDHDSLNGEWNPMMQRYVCATPSRQDETGFRVAWHKEKIPCWSAIEAGLDRKALSLAVAAMDKVRVFRTDKERKWYIAADLLGARGVIRDVAWANGSMRGFDIIASASKDGAVRIYEVTTPNDPLYKQGEAPNEQAASSASQASTTKLRSAIPSGLAAGLAAMPTSTKDALKDSDRLVPGRVRHEVKKVAELTAHDGSVWRVVFSQLGDLLVSSGDDGSVKTWKKALTGEWLEYSQIDLTSQD